MFVSSAAYNLRSMFPSFHVFACDSVVSGFTFRICCFAAHSHSFSVYSVYTDNVRDEPRIALKCCLNILNLGKR